jgi:hypothetical protein
MTLAPSTSKSLRLASPDHPRFVGLALLRSLLTHEDVASQSVRSDAVLDLIGLLLRDAPAQQVVKAFCKVRRHCGAVCYLAIFRFRRWLEQQIVAKTTTGTWHALDLSFQDFRRIEQHYRRQSWEAGSGGESAWEGVAVDFAWNVEMHSEPAASATATV